MATDAKVFVGVDIGGTFTDVVMVRGDRMPVSVKVLTTHDDYCRGVVEGISEALIAGDSVGGPIERVVHATTLGSNTLLEGTGATVGLITTVGFRDILEIGRLRRPSLYDASYRKVPPLVSRENRLEIDERMAAGGLPLVKPKGEDVLGAAARLIDAGADVIAVCLLNAYANPDHEEAVRASINAEYPEVLVVTSTETLKEMREYERFSTAVVNAYLTPVFRNYLGRLTRELDAIQVAAPLLMMQSSGGLVSAATAARQPVRIIESGPAAGVQGAARLARELGLDQVVALDMGGTTAKATVITGGRPRESYEYEVGPGLHKGSRLFGGNGYVVRVPAVDIAEIGAGGGSIAWTDPLGVIHVGPKSAGSSPGPACYGRGGVEPTVTDANVVLGYLSSDSLAGGTIPISREAAATAVARIAQGTDTAAVVKAAHSIHAVAISNMIRAIRAVTTENGLDPALFGLVSFGGSGPIHSVGVARKLGITQVIVPPLAGIYSALGMLGADVKYDEVQTVLGRLSSMDPGRLASAFEAARGRLMERIRLDGMEPSAANMRLLADIRFSRQSSELSVEISEPPRDRADLDRIAADFLEQYAATYGGSGDLRDIELVNLRVAAEIALVPGFSPAQIAAQMRTQPAAQTGEREVYFGPELSLCRTRVFASRYDVGEGEIGGPILIEEPDTTIIVPPGDSFHLDECGNAHINVRMAVLRGKTRELAS